MLEENLLVVIGGAEVCCGGDRLDGCVSEATVVEGSGPHVVLVVGCLLA